MEEAKRTRLRLVIDIETNSLVRPRDIWVVVCKDIDTGKVYIFREVTKDEESRNGLLDLLSKCSLLVGHHHISFDIPVLCTLLGLQQRLNPLVRYIDTYIISKLIHYSNPGGHSLENLGLELGLEKIKFNEFTKYSKEMEEYCVRDVEVCHKIYLKHLAVIDSPTWADAIALEHDFQFICNDLHDNGFAFNSGKAEKLLDKIQKEISILDKEIADAFPPRLVAIKEVCPRTTLHGTLNKSDFRWVADGDLSVFNGGSFTRCELKIFNPDSHKQICDTLASAGWKPEEKTQGHIDTLRSLSRAKGEEKKELEDKLIVFSKYGWRVNETNLSTLPINAPPPARYLAKRITLESRRRTLTEWLGLVQEDGRIHGRFQGIGAWTHRMAHQEPNTANIPREFNIGGTKKVYGKELRELWIAPKGKILVGVDAEGIQLRIFAHYIEDEEFTDALVRGRKSDKSDPHSLNQRILGSVCKTRDAAKRFIYALLLGGGMSKLAAILEASEADTKKALDRLLLRYKGFAFLRENIFPNDAKRGYFVGLDGRHTPIPGESIRDRQHLAMSGYLQNGEVVVIKRAALIARQQIKAEPLLKSWIFVDIVHDELQSEVTNDMRIALQVAEIKANAIKAAGEYYKLKCPMAGSYWSDERKDYTIGTNWYQTH